MMQLTFTVPAILQALFHAAKQNPLAIIPRKRRQIIFIGFEKRFVFLKISLGFSKNISGIIIRTAKKKMRLVAQSWL